MLSRTSVVEPEWNLRASSRRCVSYEISSSSWKGQPIAPSRVFSSLLPYRPGLLYSVPSVARPTTLHCSMMCSGSSTLLALTRTWRMHAYPTRAYIISVQQHSSTWVCLGDFFFLLQFSNPYWGVGKLASGIVSSHARLRLLDEQRADYRVFQSLHLLSPRVQLEAGALHSESTSLRLRLTPRVVVSVSE